MTAQSDMMKLYSTRILALAAEIPHLGRLADAQATGMKRSPLCGSKVTVDLSLDAQGRVVSYGQDVKACALGQASAAISGAQVIGLSRADIQTGRDGLHKMLTEGGPIPPAPFAEFEVLTPAIEYKNRHASILLALDATLEAMEMATTETA